MRFSLGVSLACSLLLCGGCGPGRDVPSSAEGRTLYAENGCATCHGPSGRGDGPVGATLPRRPRNFTDESSYTNGRDAASIAATLAVGISANGSKMPAFGHLNERERLSLAEFVIFLRNAK